MKTLAFGAFAFAAAFALGVPAHATETVLLTSGNWVVKRVSDPRGSFCGVSSVQNPMAQLATPQRLIFPLGVDLPMAGFVKLPVLPTPTTRAFSPQERIAKALYIEGVELGQLMSGLALVYAVPGHPNVNIDGKGLKGAADSAQAKCTLPATPASNAPTQAQIDQMAADMKAKAAQVENALNNQAQALSPSVSPKPSAPTPPSVPPTQEGGLKPPSPKAPVPPGAAPTGSVGASLPPAGLNTANLSSAQLDILLKQIVSQQAAMQQAPTAIVNTQCSAVAVTRMQAQKMTNAQITQICR